MSCCNNLLGDACGVTMIERALIAALVATAAATILGAMGTEVSKVLDKVNAKPSG